LQTQDWSKKVEKRSRRVMKWVAVVMIKELVARYDEFEK